MFKNISSSPSALSEDSTSFSQCDEKEKRSGVGPPVERETGRLNLTRNPSYRPARHPTTPLVSDSQGRYHLKRALANSRRQLFMFMNFLGLSTSGVYRAKRLEYNSLLRVE